MQLSVGHTIDIRLSRVTIFEILRRNKQSTIALVECPPEDMFPFDTHSLFSNVPYKKPTRLKKPHC